MHPDQRADSPADIFQSIMLIVVHQMIPIKLGGNDLANNGHHSMLKYVSWAICCLMRVHLCHKLLNEAVYMQHTLHADFVTLPWHSNWTMLAGRYARPDRWREQYVGRGEAGEHKFQAYLSSAP